jgi:hypothetical protein
MARFRSTFRISGSPGIQEYNMQVADWRKSLLNFFELNSHLFKWAVVSSKLQYI